MATLNDKYPLESTKPLKKTLASLWLFILIIAFIVLFSYPILKEIKISIIASIIAFVAIIITYIILKYIYEIFYLKYYFYDQVGKNLIIKKGVFSRNEITLPMNRLQDVYVDQDVLDRIFGLYDVHVSTATMISGNLSHIDGLNKANADVIKKLILSKIHKENA